MNIDYFGGPTRMAGIASPFAGTTMTDYWLSKFFFEMRDPALRAEYAAAPEAVHDRFRLSREARTAIVNRDVSFLSKHVNAYLLRYFCGYMDMPDAEFLEKIRASKAGTAGRG